MAGRSLPDMIVELEDLHIKYGFAKRAFDETKVRLLADLDREEVTGNAAEVALLESAVFRAAQKKADVLIDRAYRLKAQIDAGVVALREREVEVQETMERRWGRIGRID